MSNKQELFNQSVLGVYSQGKPSRDPVTLDCQYRGPDGLKCAVGHILPDEAYNSRLEGNTVWNDTVIGALGLKMSEDKDTLFMLQELQRLHDCQTLVGDEPSEAEISQYQDDFKTYWAEGCKVIAQKYGVQMPELMP